MKNLERHVMQMTLPSKKLIDKQPWLLIRIKEARMKSFKQLMKPGKSCLMQPRGVIMTG